MNNSSYYSHSDRNCMTIVAGKGISATGHVLLAHNEDDGGRILVRHGLVPSREHIAGTMLPAEPGLAQIPQVPQTLGFWWTEVRNYAGGMSSSDLFVNECGVTVCSDSAGDSREIRPDAEILTDGGIWYNIRRAVAERSHSAREAAQIICTLASEYGYASSGRIYIVADADEAFAVMLVRGKHFLAARIPDDAVMVLPNHYTLHSLTDVPEEWGSEDLVSYAEAQGWYCPEDGPFDFARTYQAESGWHAPWNMLRQKYASRTILGRDASPEEETSFCIYPELPVTVEKLKEVMSTHYEGTDDDIRFGPAGGPHYTANRRICTGTTIESVIVEAEKDPRNTTVWTAFGWPCVLPYEPLHPLRGEPEGIGCMNDPSAMLENHFVPIPGELSRTLDLWQNMRERCLLSELLGKSGQPVSLGISSGSFPSEGSVTVSVLFSPADEPKEESLLFGLGGLDMRSRWVSAVPGSMRRTFGGWEADFAFEDFPGEPVGPGVYDFYLGGTDSSGIPFAGVALLNLE